MITDIIIRRIFRYKITRQLFHYFNDLFIYLRYLFKFDFRNRIKKNIISKEEKFELLSRVLPSHQLRGEFSAFLKHVNNQKLNVIVEIGTADCGTHLLLSELIPGKKMMIAIDLEIRNTMTCKLFNSNGDQKFFISGSSHDNRTYNRLTKLLNNSKIDLLFIDGDHSYLGVKKDFEIYKSFVSDKGIIAFHDIVPDIFSRTGTKTNSYVGEVPKFWSEIKNNYNSLEFIESSKQDGCGIGVIHFEKT